MKKTMPVIILVVLALAIFAPLVSASSSLRLSHLNPRKFVETVQSEVINVNPLAGSKWAVIIGIADYQGTSSDLWHPDEDAKEMYTELTRQQGYPKANVKLLTNKGATAQAIVNAIDWLITNEKAGDEVVFF